MILIDWIEPITQYTGCFQICVLILLDLDRFLSMSQNHITLKRLPGCPGSREKQEFAEFIRRFKNARQKYQTTAHMHMAIIANLLS